MDIRVCPVCGINQLNGEFRWSFSNKVATSEELTDRVCVHVEKSGKKGCLNLI